MAIELAEKCLTTANIYWAILCARHCSDCSAYKPFYLFSIPGGKCYCEHQFTIQKIKVRRMTIACPGHTVNKWWCQDLNTGRLASELVVLPTIEKVPCSRLNRRNKVICKKTDCKVKNSSRKKKWIRANGSGLNCEQRGKLWMKAFFYLKPSIWYVGRGSPSGLKFMSRAGWSLPYTTYDLDEKIRGMFGKY